MRIGDARRLQVGRDEHGVDPPDCDCLACGLGFSCGYVCDYEGDWDDWDESSDEDDGLALLGVAMLTASLHRPFEGLKLPTPAGRA